MRIVLTAAILCLAAPASAQATYHDFRSPSGKIACAFYSDAEVPRVRALRLARIRRPGPASWARPGRARLRHVTDSVMNPEAKVLRYGRSTTFGGSSASRAGWVSTCRSLASGHGFRVSVEKQEMF